MRYILFALFGFSLFIVIQLSASIVNTKHNLSVSATAGTIKATSETEVCVFCHVPHFAKAVGKPLWNRSMPTSSYIMYSSDYLKRMGYTTPTSLGSANDTPGALSRQCLSCHDGTIAVGAVSKLRYSYNGAQIDLANDNPDGTLPNTAVGFIGTDLSHHHPIGAKYDPTISKTFGVGVRTSELKTTPDAPIKLFEYPGYTGKYIECSSCHDPHKDNGKFLHVTSGANHAQNFVNTCTSCHQKTDWVGGAHQAPPGTPAYTDAALIARYGTGLVSNLGCANCHVPHNGQGVGYLNRQVLEQTCFQGAASSEAGAKCHGVGGAKDIKSVLSRTYVHPVLAEHNLPGTQHTNLDSLYGTGNLDPLAIKGMAWSENKHAVCMDCHNPHRAKPGTHVTDGTWYGTPSATGNLVSNVLKGVPGIEPTWPTAWAQPTTFTTLESATKEYQICFKCHSYWGVGVATKGLSTYTSAGGTPLTDVAWEMNINNKSGHPVVIAQSGRTGSLPPRELGVEQVIAPWIANLGNQAMYCSDCHGSDNELNGDPKGPHGSNLKYILKGTNQYWPKKSTGVLYTLTDIFNGTDTGVICKNCHDILVPHANWTQNMKNQARNTPCVGCHVAVPHGSPVSRLIGYSTWPAPYNYGGNSLKMLGWVKNGIYNPLDPGTKNNAWTSTPTTCVNGMGTACHGTSAATYDANLMP